MRSALSQKHIIDIDIRRQLGVLTQLAVDYHKM
jgi:hypothetical protein